MQWEVLSVNGEKKYINKIETLHMDTLFLENVELKRLPLKVTMVYAIVGGLWVIFSDEILNMLIESKSLMVKIQTIKGFGFVLVSSFIIYFFCLLYTSP